MIPIFLVMAALVGADIHLFAKVQNLEKCKHDAYRAIDNGYILELKDHAFCRTIRIPTSLPAKKIQGKAVMI